MSARLLLTLTLLIGATALAATEAEQDTTSTAKVKYKAGKEMDFEKLVIEGQLKRPELSVVTGDSDENGNGLLRLRENFVDRMAEAAGEDAP